MLVGPSSHRKMLFDEESEKTPVEMSTSVVCIPKTEPFLDVSANSKDDVPNFDAPQPFIPYTSPYKLKDPIIVLERCDKIWKTLRLIKNAQSSNTYYDEGTKCENKTSEVKNNGSYVKYQPVLGSSNEKLPNFQLSVKAKRKVYNCTICGKQYLHSQKWKNHGYRMHGIPFETKREFPRDREQNKGIDNQVAENNKAIHLSKPKQALVRKIEQTAFVVHIQEDKKSGIPVSKCNDSSTQHNLSIDNTSIQNERQQQESLNQSKQDELNTIPKKYKCSLCKREVRYPREHIGKYHKIVSGGTKIENFCAPIYSKQLAKKRHSAENTGVGVQGNHFIGEKRKGSALDDTRKRMRYSTDHNYCYRNTEVLHTRSSSQTGDSASEVTSYDDEDVVVDIEDDAPINSCDTKNPQNARSTTSKLTMVKKFEAKDRNANKIASDEEQDMKYVCPCGNRYENENVLRNHTLEAHRLLLKCAYCKKTFDNITQVTKHICSVEGVPGEPFDSVLKLSCCYCNMEVDVKDMDYHKQSQHGKFKPECYFCSETFDSSRARNMHSRAVHSEAQRCEVCYELLTFDAKIKHRAYHSGVGWPCHKCFRAYESKLSLKYHTAYVHLKKYAKNWK